MPRIVEAGQDRSSKAIRQDGTPSVTNARPTRGAIYFMVKYLDRDMLVPVIETYFCVGQDLQDRSWSFQNALTRVNEGLVEIEAVPGREDCMTVSDQDVSDAFLGWSDLVQELAENKALQDRGMTLAQRDQV